MGSWKSSFGLGILTAFCLLVFGVRAAELLTEEVSVREDRVWIEKQTGAGLGAGEELGGKSRMEVDGLQKGAEERGGTEEKGETAERGERGKTAEKGEGGDTAEKGEAAVRREVEGAKTVALTFDDGPHEEWTPALLDGLKERGVKATFFLMGQNIPGKEAIVERMAQEGHLIGNHSYEHIQLTRAGTEEVCQAIERTGEMIRELTGEKPQYVRPPYGDWNEELECQTGLTTVLWDVDSLDWKYRERSRVVEKVCREVEDGDIILMHDIFRTSKEAALDIVDRLLADGWQFVTVDELLVD